MRKQGTTPTPTSRDDGFSIRQCLRTFSDGFSGSPPQPLLSLLLYSIWLTSQYKKYSRIKIYDHNWPSSQILSSSELAVLMVKQNKAKVSKSKWVFLLNVIALGMAGDGYWSASSLAITVGMAISKACWFLGKQHFLVSLQSGVQIESSRTPRKNNSFSRSFTADSVFEKCLSFIDGWNLIVSLLVLGYESRYMPMGHSFIQGGIYKGKCWPWLHKRSKGFLLIEAVLTGWDNFFSPYKTIKWNNEFWLEGWFARIQKEIQKHWRAMGIHYTVW